MLERSLRFQGHVNVRGDPGDGAFMDAVRGVLGFELPTAANTIAASATRVAYWLGPDEWLVATAVEDEAPLAQALRAALGAVFSSVTEVGGGNVVIVLEGGEARDVLAKECPLDLHPRALAVGQCAQTRLAKAAVLLRPLEGGAMEVTVRRSFADYVCLWLERSTAEEGT